MTMTNTQTRLLTRVRCPCMVGQTHYTTITKITTTTAVNTTTITMTTTTMICESSTKGKMIFKVFMRRITTIKTITLLMTPIMNKIMSLSMTPTTMITTTSAQQITTTNTKTTTMNITTNICPGQLRGKGHLLTTTSNSALV